MVDKNRIAECRRKYYIRNHEKLKEYARDYYRKHRDKIRTHNNTEQIREKMRENLKKARKNLLDLFGNKCSNPNCLVPGGCRDARCLQLDHINGGGVRELRARKGYSASIYYSIHPEEAKEKLQLLCANCNWIKKVERNETALGWRKKKL